MKVIKGYQKIHGRNRILGLEFVDVLALVATYLAVFMFSKNLLLNLAVLFGVYLILKLYKQGKPPHWMEWALRLLMTPRSYPPGQEEERSIFK